MHQPHIHFDLPVQAPHPTPTPPAHPCARCLTRSALQVADVQAEAGQRPAVPLRLLVNHPASGGPRSGQHAEHARQRPGAGRDNGVWSGGNQVGSARGGQHPGTRGPRLALGRSACPFIRLLLDTVGSHNTPALVQPAAPPLPCARASSSSAASAKSPLPSRLPSYL